MKKKKTRTRADVFLSLPKKVKLKIENNVICVEKVLQHGYKYPQNSSTTFFPFNSIGLLVNFTFLNNSFDKSFEYSQIFVQHLSKLKISWCSQLSETVFFYYWNATPYLICLQNRLRICLLKLTMSIVLCSEDGIILTKSAVKTCS